MADMMSMLSLETKKIIFDGLKEENLINPFIVTLANKNSFSLNKSDYKPSYNNNLSITPMGVAFFIAPFVNAMVRSGTLEEQQLVFKSFLTMNAFEPMPELKYNKPTGNTVRLVDRAIQVCEQVKRRQTKAETEGMEMLESLIEKNNMLDNKVLLFLLEPGQIDKNIAGLVANKFMAKYQRPCCVLTRIDDVYQGSARGCKEKNVSNFKDLCDNTGVTEFTAGHQGAFGLGIKTENINKFIELTNIALKDIPDEPIYFVDYIWNHNTIDGDKILEIAEMNDYWGKDIERSIVYIEGIRVNKDSFLVMKSNTLKYKIDCGIDIIQFGGTEEEIDKFSDGRTYIINVICKCCANEWNGIHPQLQMIDYEIEEIQEPTIITSWGF